MHNPSLGQLIAVLRQNGNPSKRYTEYELFGENEVSLISICRGLIVEKVEDGFLVRHCSGNRVENFNFDYDTTTPPDKWTLGIHTWNRLHDIATATNSQFYHVPSKLIDPSEAQQAARHEDDLVNHRTGWFVSTQGLLFASLAFAWEGAPQIVLPFAVLGLLLSLSALWAAQCSNRAFYRAELQSPEAPGYSILQSHPRLAFLGVWALPWNSFPFFFIFTWLWIGYHCLHRPMT